MSESHLETTDKRLFSPGTLMVVACTVAASALDKGGYLEFTLGLLLFYSIALPIEYWFLPKPRLGYSKYLVLVAAYMLIGLTGFWALPRMLERWLGKPLAYGLPIMVLGIAAYWLPRLYRPEKRERLWLWSLCVIAFAVLFAWTKHE